MQRFARSVFMLALASASPLAAAAAPTETVLYRFDQAPRGLFPYGGLIGDPAKALYGVAVNGGLRLCAKLGCGTVYKAIPPSPMFPSWRVGVLYQFMGGSDGSLPLERLVAGPDGALYGVTVAGGDGSCSVASTAGCGTVFRLTPPAAGQTAWTETILHRFAGAPDGAYPLGPLALDSSGALYGATKFGGMKCPEATDNGCGLVFKLTPPGAGNEAWTTAVVHAFAGSADGYFPQGGLVLDAQGALYGTTGGFGAKQAYSTVFKLTPRAAAAWSEQILHRFDTFKDIAQGNLLLERSTGTLYGTTFARACGPTGPCDKAYSLTVPSSGQGVLAVLHGFSQAEGVFLSSGLIAAPGGGLYGTASQHGAGCNTCGAVFLLRRPAAGQAQWSYVLLHAFTGTPDGAGPAGGLVVAPGGVLYGTTAQGGATGGGASSEGGGTIFEIVR